MECKKCGNVLPENAKFCFECGAKVESEVICATCGTKMPEGYKFCMECGSVLSDSGKLVEKGQSDKVDDDVDWDSILSMIPDKENDLEELRNDIKNMIQNYIEECSNSSCFHHLKYVEVQENVIWTGSRLIDLRELATIEEMRKHIGENLNSKMVNFWHMCWPQWEVYCRELDYSTSWVGGICGNTFYYITGKEKGATLHKSAIGTGNKEDIETWSEVRIFEDKEKNFRILANNLQENGYHSKEWILLNDSGEVLWENENATALRVRAQGWCLDYWQAEDKYNFCMLLDFYTGNILLNGYCDYAYYINDKMGEIIIAANKIDDDGKFSAPHLYHYKNGVAIRLKDEEIVRYGINLPKASFGELKIPQFKEIEYMLREVYELPTRI